ncbi:MAG: hypothetical protein LC715_00775 [Gammaproteobacteria bacterium]|nr:hypothetical protein [Gammaproteobacteria bacterium]
MAIAPITRANLFGPGSQSGLDPGRALERCRLREGPCRGAYTVAPGGAVVWYFSNLALTLGLASSLTSAARVKTYLDRYLSRLEPDFTIRDVIDPEGVAHTVDPDSHDAYASTLLTLACGYAEWSGDWAWLRARQQLLKDIAYANLALAQKPSGLIACFQRPGSVGYLKDNCENWQGLDRLHRALQRLGDPDRGYFDLVAQGVLLGIDSLFDRDAASWRPADVPTIPGFYPDLVCQAYPEALGVPVAQAWKDAGYARLNLLAPGWENGAYDVFPWMMLGAVAAARGDAMRALTQLRMCDALYASEPARVTCNELGWYVESRRRLG